MRKLRPSWRLGMEPMISDGQQRLDREADTATGLSVASGKTFGKRARKKSDADAVFGCRGRKQNKIEILIGRPVMKFNTWAYLRSKQGKRSSALSPTFKMKMSEKQNIAQILRSWWRRHIVCRSGHALTTLPRRHRQWTHLALTVSRWVFTQMILSNTSKTSILIRGLSAPHSVG